MKKITYIIILVIQLLIASTAWAQQAFVVKSIQFQGLQRISQETAQSYLPIKSGQVLSTAKTPAILRALYQTGFFEKSPYQNQEHFNYSCY